MFNYASYLAGLLGKHYRDPGQIQGHRLQSSSLCEVES